MTETNLEILPPEITDFRLPPGLELPTNVIMTEEEAARFCRDTPQRFRRYRFAGEGPAFVESPCGNCGVTYLLWDVLAWMVARRRNVPTRIRGRRSDPQAAAA